MMRFEIDMERLTWSDLDALENVQDSGKLRPIRPLLARFMVDDAGKTVPFDDAMIALGALTLSQIKTAVSAFVEEIARSQKSAVPPDSSGV